MAHLSDLLHQVHAFRGDWARVELAGGQRLAVPRSPDMYFHIVLDGEVTIHTKPGWTQALATSDVAIVFGEVNHWIGTDAAGREGPLNCFDDNRSPDAPPVVRIGSGKPVAKLLVGRIGISWPAVLRPAGMPTQLFLRMGQSKASAREIATTFRRACSGPGASAYLTKLAELAMLRTLRENIDTLSVLPTDAVSLQISRALRLVEGDPGGPWSVGRLASAIGMSRSSFADKFLRCTGKRPMEVVAEFRMRAAAEMLETSALSIAELSGKVGYQSEAAFTRRFEQEFGITPGRYRRTSSRQRDEQWKRLSKEHMAPLITLLGSGQ